MKYRYRFYKHYFCHTFLRGMRCRLFLCNYMMFIILKMLIFFISIVNSLDPAGKKFTLWKKKAECFKKEKKKKTFQRITNTLESSQNNKIKKTKTDKNNIWEETPFPVAVCLFYYFIMNFYKEISYEVLRCELF